MPLSNPFCNLASLQTGQSASETATSGVDVVFDKVCAEVPRVVIGLWQKDVAWLTQVTTTGFSWEGDSNDSTIDWIAIVDNG